MRRKMKENFRIVSLLLVLACCIGLWAGLGVTAYANDQKVVDMSDLLTDEEENKLQDRLTVISEEYQCDVVAATTDSFEGKDRWQYTDEFYYNNDYGYGDTVDGIILMVNLHERQFQYLTRGKATDIFTDYGLEVIDEQVTPYLSDGEYYEAFMKYADMAKQFLKEADSDRPYDVNHAYKQKLSMPARIGIAVGVGLVVTVLVLLILFGQLRTVRAKGQAQEYVRQGSFRVTKAYDLFLYRTVSRHKIERSNGGGRGGGSSTRSSVGGGRGGGRGGSF